MSCSTRQTIRAEYDFSKAVKNPYAAQFKKQLTIRLDEKCTSAVQETVYLLAVPGMRESIKAAMAKPLAKSAKALKW